MAHSQAHICHCLGRIRNIRRDSPLTIAGDRRRSGEEFAGGVISLARGLSKLGIRSGDVVAIAALNSDFYMEWLLAITYVGGIAAPLNYRWSFEEARLAMEVVSPVMLVVDESCSSWDLTLQDGHFVPSLRLYAFIGDYSSARSFSKSGNFLPMDSIRMPVVVPTMPEIMWAPKGIALLCFTSGVSSYSSSLPHWRDFFVGSHVNSSWLPCIYAKI